LVSSDERNTCTPFAPYGLYGAVNLGFQKEIGASLGLRCLAGGTCFARVARKDQEMRPLR
jgi:hypothetical protein